MAKTKSALHLQQLANILDKQSKRRKSDESGQLLANGSNNDRDMADIDCMYDVAKLLRIISNSCGLNTVKIGNLIPKTDCNKVFQSENLVAISVLKYNHDEFFSSGQRKVSKGNRSREICVVVDSVRSNDL